MVESNVLSIARAYLKRCTELVRGLARQLGVNYAPWPDVRQRMTDCQLDPVELANFLGDAEVKETECMFGMTRYRLESEDIAERIESATVAIHSESQTIEIIVLRIKGDHHG